MLFIALIDNGYLPLQFDPLYERITLGALLLAAVGLDVLQRGLLQPATAVRQLVRKRRSVP